MFETLSLFGTIGATALALNFWGIAAFAARAWVPFDPAVVSLLVFWLLFVALYVIVHVVLARVARLVKWERLHWTIQGIGMAVGGLKGLWVSGLIVTALAVSGFDYLKQSVEHESIFGPPLLRLSHEAMVQAADRFPGAGARGTVLIPPVKPPDAKP